MHNFFFSFNWFLFTLMKNYKLNQSLENISNSKFDWIEIQSEMKKKFGKDIFESWIKKIQFVKLVPMDSEAEIKYILLGIDVEFNQIYKVIETGKNDTQTTIAIIDFEVNLPLEENLFVFDKENYICVHARNVVSGKNKQEVAIVQKNRKRKGFFEKLFHLFK